MQLDADAPQHLVVDLHRPAMAILDLAPQLRVLSDQQCLSARPSRGSTPMDSDLSLASADDGDEQGNHRRLGDGKGDPTALRRLASRWRTGCRTTAP